MQKKEEINESSAFESYSEENKKIVLILILIHHVIRVYYVCCMYTYTTHNIHSCTFTDTYTNGNTYRKNKMILTSDARLRLIFAFKRWLCIFNLYRTTTNIPHRYGLLLCTIAPIYASVVHACEYHQSICSSILARNLFICTTQIHGQNVFITARSPSIQFII